MTTLSNLEGEEKFDASFLGEAKAVYEQAIGDNDFVFIKEPKNKNISSIILRGANIFMLDEIERFLYFELS